MAICCEDLTANYREGQGTRGAGRPDSEASQARRGVRRGGGVQVSEASVAAMLAAVQERNLVPPLVAQQHHWRRTLCKVRHSCYSQCYQDSYAWDRAWQCAHILRMWMEYARRRGTTKR